MGQKQLELKIQSITSMSELYTFISQQRLELGHFEIMQLIWNTAINTAASIAKSHNGKDWKPKEVADRILRQKYYTTTDE